MSDEQRDVCVCWNNDDDNNAFKRRINVYVQSERDVILTRPITGLELILRRLFRSVPAYLLAASTRSGRRWCWCDATGHRGAVRTTVFKRPIITSDELAVGGGGSCVDADGSRKD